MSRINVERYMTKLKSVLDEKSTPQRNLWMSPYYVVDPVIYKTMADYIQENYASYYSNELPDLIFEHKALYKACLNNLGIR